jgi:hypothetical protein
MLFVRARSSAKKYFFDFQFFLFFLDRMQRAWYSIKKIRHSAALFYFSGGYKDEKNHVFGSGHSFGRWSGICQGRGGKSRRKENQRLQDR